MKDPQDVFADLLQESSPDELDDAVRAVCAEHPELARELQRRLDEWKAYRALLGRLEERLGAGFDLEELASEPEDGDEMRVLLAEIAGVLRPEQRYEVAARIGRGGMSEVFEIVDRALERRLAMKVLPVRGQPEVGDGSSGTGELRSLRRFLAEARVTGALDHPGIVPVHDLGVDAQGQVFFTMRRIEGLRLDQVFERLRAGTDEWTLPRVLGHLLQVCQTVAYAHDRGVIHRDLKPSNIMVGRFNETYVLDWGLAWQVGTEDPHDLRLAGIEADGVEPSAGISTVDGHVLGTPCYMSPEQAQGHVHSLGPRSDVYCLGAVLYHLLTGRAPYVESGPDGDTPAPRAVLDHLASGPPRKLSAVAPQAPAELVSIAEKAMHRDAARRYPDARELAADLQAFLEGRVVQAHARGALIGLRKWTSRNRGLAISLAIAAIAVMWSLVLVLQNALTQADVARLEATAAVTRERIARLELQTRDAESQVLLRELESALRADQVVDPDQYQQRIPPEDRNWEWQYLRRRAEGSLAVLGDEGGSSVRALATNPSLGLLASGNDEGWVVLRDTQSLEAVQRFQVDEAVGALSFHPAGTLLAIGRADGMVEVRDARSGLLIAASEPSGDPIVRMSFDAEGGRLVTSQDFVLRLWTWNGSDLVLQHEVALDLQHYERLYDAAFVEDSDEVLTLSGGVDFLEGGLTRPLSLTNTKTYGVLPHPDGSDFLTAGWDGSVRRRDRVTGRIWWENRLDPTGRSEMAVTTLALTPDQGHVLAGGWAKIVRVLDGATGRSLQSLRGHTDRITQIVVLPDGGRFASASLDGTVRVWSVDAVDGVRVLQHPWFVFDAAFSPDSRQVAATCRNGTLYVYDVNRGQPLWGSTSPAPSPGLATLCHEVAWSPDGRLIATTEGDLQAYIPRPGERIYCAFVWDAATGELLLTLDGHGSFIYGLDFSPDGALLATGTADGLIRLWSPSTGELMEVLEGHAPGLIRHIAFSPDGRELLVCCDDTARIWDVETWNERIVFEGHEWPVRAARWSPDGQHIASCSADIDHTTRKRVFVWDSSSGEVFLELDGHELGVLDVNWSPDGTRLATASEDRTVRIWDAEDGRQLLVLRGHTGWVGNVGWSPDGRVLASTSADGTLRLWETGVPRKLR